MEGNSTISKHKRWHQKWWGMTLIGFLAFFLIICVAFGFFVFDLSDKIKRGEISADTFRSQQSSQLEATTTVRIGKYWLGTANPKADIILFSDFACPYCKDDFTIVRSIAYRHPDTRISFRDFPIHDASLDLAMAARCAGEQGLFWPMHDKLFQNQGIETIDDFTRLGDQIGIDQTKFTTCFNNQKYMSDIQADFVEGDRLGVVGTPTWFINGKKYEGFLSSDALDKIINEIKK